MPVETAINETWSRFAAMSEFHVILRQRSRQSNAYFQILAPGLLVAKGQATSVLGSSISNRCEQRFSWTSSRCSVAFCANLGGEMNEMTSLLWSTQPDMIQRHLGMRRKDCGTRGAYGGLHQLTGTMPTGPPSIQVSMDRPTACCRPIT